MKTSFILLFVSIVFISCSRDLKKEWINTCRITFERIGQSNSIQECHKYSQMFHEECEKQSVSPSNALNLVNYNSCMGHKVKGERQKFKWSLSCTTREKDNRNPNYNDDCKRWQSRFHDECMESSNNNISQNVFENKYESCMNKFINKEKETFHKAKMKALKEKRDQLSN